MIYLTEFTFPSNHKETEFLLPKHNAPTEPIEDNRAKNYYGSLYPFKVLDNDKLCRVEFDTITFFCGGNGCGKTTALNVIAEKLALKRDGLYNCGRFFQDYLNLCEHSINDNMDNYFRTRFGEDANAGRGINLPIDSRIIVSDDVFAHSMRQRKFNENINNNRGDVEHRYNEILLSDPRMRSLEDYDRFAERIEARKSKTKFMKQHLGEEVPEHSNGETALMYFLERMENPGLYLLDEPENSLSLDNQIKLAEFIADSACFFNYQFIIATHSPIFLATNGARIYDFDCTPAKVKKWTEVNNVKTMYNFFKSCEAEFEC